MTAGFTGVEFNCKAATQGAHHIIQATKSEGLAQGPYVAARVGFEPATFCSEGIEHHHSATTPLLFTLSTVLYDEGAVKVLRLKMLRVLVVRVLMVLGCYGLRGLGFYGFMVLNFRVLWSQTCQPSR